MAITYHLPIKEWYFSEISEWTIDYPPFFAYFEKFLSIFAHFYDPTILILQSESFITRKVLIFQRISVLIFDIIYVNIFPLNYFLDFFLHIFK